MIRFTDLGSRHNVETKLKSVVSGLVGMTSFNTSMSQ